jgi:hypothetical protein
MPIATTTEWNLRRRKQRALRELRELLRSNIMRGSIVETTRRCGKPNCACAKDERRRHARRTVTVNIGGRTRTVHLDDAHQPEVREATARYRRLWRVLDELTELNLKLLAFPPATTGGEQ